MTTLRRTMGSSFAAGIIIPLLLATQPGAAAQTELDPDHVRARLEGTFQLEEWYLDGQVIRPPQIGGIYSLNDDILTAYFYRTQGDAFQTAAAHGRYRIEGSTYYYGYDNVLSAGGPSFDEASVNMRPDGELDEFDISVEGDTVVVQRPNDRREFGSDGTFKLFQNGVLVRIWRRVH